MRPIRLRSWIVGAVVAIALATFVVATALHYLLVRGE